MPAPIFLAFLFLIRFRRVRPNIVVLDNELFLATTEVG